MRSLMIAAALHVGVMALASTPGSAQDAGAFAPFLTKDSKECVSVNDIEKVASSTKALNTPTFRFVQALYAAIPPISKKLPPGDHAELAIDKTGVVIAFLIDGDRTC